MLSLLGHTIFGEYQVGAGTVAEDRGQSGGQV